MTTSDDLARDNDAPRASREASRRWGDLGARAGSAVVLVAIAVVAALQGGGVFVFVWLAASIAVLWEWQRLIDPAGLSARLGVGVCILGVCAVLASRLDLAAAMLVVLAGCGLLALFASPGKRIWAAGGMLYAGLLLLSVVSLRVSFPFGARSIVWLFATVWTTDCFAYFGGRLIGGPKLWPRVSPSKTWSGTLTGVLGGAVIGTVVAVRDLPDPWSLAPILVLTLAAAALSQAGDAFESGIKRHFGVKDSSHLIPGHGGVMDRLDGFVAAAVFAFMVGMIRNVPSVAGGLFYWA